jgi:hypothetical protein
MFRLTNEHLEKVVNYLGEDGIERSHALGLLHCLVRTNYATASLDKALSRLAKEHPETVVPDVDENN